MNLKLMVDEKGEFFVNDPTPEEKETWDQFYPPVPATAKEEVIDKK
jgi:hypothetical protein